jgi:hypothetical protein
LTNRLDWPARTLAPGWSPKVLGRERDRHDFFRANPAAVRSHRRTDSWGSSARVVIFK